MKQTILSLFLLLGTASAALAMQEKKLVKLLATDIDPTLRSYLAGYLSKYQEATRAETIARLRKEELERYVNDNILVHNLMLDELRALATSKES